MYKKYIKRVLDILFSLIGIIPLLIIIIPISIIIYIEDRGPIFYNAQRLGKNGKIFKMYKFRTMKVNAPDLRNKDGSTFNSNSDPRLTKIGKFLRKTSIDELPQLLNVLKGDMSLIGPRPFIADREYKNLDNKRKKILTIKPGITGYSQAYYRNTITQKEKINNDLYYIEHISFILDIKILIKTFTSVILQKGIFNNSK